jgi:hypothetical protein
LLRTSAFALGLAGLRLTSILEVWAPKQNELFSDAQGIHDRKKYCNTHNMREESTLKTKSKSTVKGAVGTHNTPGVDDVMNKIKKEKQKLDKGEGNFLACFICLGLLLAQLRGLAKRTWNKLVVTLGFNARVALRYLNLAKSPLAGFGLNESDLLARLPSDLLKLEWICRLNAGQLNELLGRLDPKKESRPKVIAAVKEILGENDAPENPDLEGALGRASNRVVKLAGQLRSDAQTEPDKDRVEKLLSDKLRQMEEALASKATTSSPAASDAN